MPSIPSESENLWPLRLAREEDAPGLESLIRISSRTLQASVYSFAQIEAALGPVFGVDLQLIHDGTYFVAEVGGVIVGCGGWSKRRSLYGGSDRRADDDSLLDPKQDAARIRAFFVHPSRARQGIGRSILMQCERAIIDNAFLQIDIVATLVGEPLYAAFGYAVVGRFEIPLTGGLALPVVRMTKRL